MNRLEYGPVICTKGPHKGKIGYLDEYFYHYIYNDKSITLILEDSKRAELFKIYENLKEFFQEKN